MILISNTIKVFYSTQYSGAEHKTPVNVHDHDKSGFA